MSAEAIVARCPLFQEMSSEEVASVLALAERHHFRGGEVLIAEGKQTRILWVLVEGRVQVMKHAAHGGDQELAQIEPGGVFGEMSFFQTAPHSATVRTLSDSLVLQIPYDKFEHLEVAGHRAAYKVVRNLLRIVSERIRRMDDWTCKLVDNHADDSRREEWHEFRSKLYTGWNF